MDKINHLQPLDIQGIWKASYSAQQELFEPDTDPDEQATIILEAGNVTGHDPFGGVYQGSYTLDNEKFKATVKVVSSDDEVTTIFEGLDFPFTLDLSGNYTSPDYFSALGKVIERTELSIVINCRRVSDE